LIRSSPAAIIRAVSATTWLDVKSGTCYGAGENAANIGVGAFGKPSRKKALHRAYLPPVGRRRERTSRLDK
jgi:hypothetical protein